MLGIKEKGLLLNIVKHCNRIEEKSKGLTRETFDNDEDVREIICFNILQIGELAKHLPNEFCDKFNKVPWSQIKSMRDKVAHGYDTIDKKRLWETIQFDIAPLKKYCETILESN